MSVAGEESSIYNKEHEQGMHSNNDWSDQMQAQGKFEVDGSFTLLGMVRP